MLRRIIRNAVVGGSVSMLITGCAATRPQAVQTGGAPACQVTSTDARPLGTQHPTAVPGAGPRAIEPTGTLCLRDALATALRHSPELAAFSHNVRVAEGRIVQAGALPNPELELAVEEYDRGGGGFDSSETAVGLGQRFELGGKRRWRKRVAEVEGELAGWDVERMRLDVLAETAKRFTSVIAAQARLDLAGSAVELAEKTRKAVGERVMAGKEPPLQASKSEAELELARMDALEAESALAVARKRLAAMWGAERVSFGQVEGRLDGIPDTIPPLEMLRTRLVQNPDLARWDAELRLRRAVISSEKAARVPDVQVSVGYLQFEEDGTDALAFGLGLPLPLLDRNRGNISAARHELLKADVERSAMELALATQLMEIHAALTSAHQRVEMLRDKVAPAMGRAFEVAHEGYRQGKFGFLDMLDAQRGLIEVQGALIDALSDYHGALMDIQRITGTGIEEVTDKQ